jgi:hypothetical protein
VLEVVVEGTGRRWGNSLLCSGVYATRDVLAAEKGVSVIVVAGIEGGDANADNAWRLRSTDETSRLPPVAIKAELRRFVRVSLRDNNFRREVCDG